MYDVVIVGARNAGAPLARQLARAGRRVAVVDRATFPSDTVSGHTIQPAGIAQLNRWGLSHVVGAAGAPLVDRIRFDAGDVVLEGTPNPVDGVRALTAPRRTNIDALLVDEAAHAGADVMTGFTVRELLTDSGRVIGVRGADGGGVHDLRARAVVGADGQHSLVARTVAATQYREAPATTLAAYTYFGGVECNQVELYVRPNRFIVVVPTNDGQVMIAQEVAMHEAASYRADIQAGFDATLALAPQLAERVASGVRTERFRLATDMGGFFRQPYGPGWALVGDAGYHKDPITAQGMTDAFVDADRLADALHEGLDGDLDTRLARYHHERDEAVSAMYEFTCQLARVHEPPAPEILALFAALVDRPDEIARFLGLMAGSESLATFFAPDHMMELLGAPAPA